MFWKLLFSTYNFFVVSNFSFYLWVQCVSGAKLSGATREGINIFVMTLQQALWMEGFSHIKDPRNKMMYHSLAIHKFGASFVRA